MGFITNNREIQIPIILRYYIIIIVQNNNEQELQYHVMWHYVLALPSTPLCQTTYAKNDMHRNVV